MHHGVFEQEEAEVTLVHLSAPSVCSCSILDLEQEEAEEAEGALAHLSAPSAGSCSILDLEQEVRIQL